MSEAVSIPELNIDAASPEVERAAGLAHRLRTLTGADEDWLRRRADPAPVITAHLLLARCLAHHAAAQLDSLAQLRALSPSERDWLLLVLRRRSFGTRLTCNVMCPDCRESLELMFFDHELPLEVSPLARPCAFPIPSGGSVTLRPLTAGDQETCARSAYADESDQRALVRRLALTRIDALSARVEEAFRPDWTAEDLATIDAAIEDGFPESITIDTFCSECGQILAGQFDIPAFVLGELRMHAAVLLDDVHRLARSYHWSERQILRLPLPRRTAYLARVEADHDSALFGISGEVS